MGSSKRVRGGSDVEHEIKKVCVCLHVHCYYSFVDCSSWHVVAIQIAKHELHEAGADARTVSLWNDIVTSEDEEEEEEGN